MSSRSIGLSAPPYASPVLAVDFWTRFESRLRRCVSWNGANRYATAERPFTVADETVELLACARRLRFPPRVEQAFRDDYFLQSIAFARLAQLVALCLYAVFGVLDCWGMPASRAFAWAIRYCVVCPAMSAVFAASFLPVFRRLMQPALAGVMIAASLGITAMIARARAAEPAYSHYYAGLILVVVAAFTFLQLRLPYALFAASITIVAYEIVAIFEKRLLAGPTGRSLLLNSNFFFLSACILGTTACYFLEYYRRKDFVHRRAAASEMLAAREVQQALMPDYFPEIPGLSVAGACRTSREIGGDYVDVLPSGPDRWLFVVADVSGKGAAAALLMANVHAIMRTVSAALNLHELAALINEHLLQFMNRARYLTCILASYEPSTRRLRYLNAGHCGGALIALDGRVERLESTGFPLGLFAGAVWSVKELDMPAGTTLALYTDGITDRQNKCGATYDEERLLNYVAQAPWAAPEQTIKAVIEDNDAFAAGIPMADDSTLLLARAAPAASH